MSQSKPCLVFLLLLLAFSATISIGGFNFLTNQYVYYRYSEEAGIPYIPQTRSTVDDNVINDPDDTRAQVQTRTANTLALMSFLSLGFSIFAVMFVGYISDRYGRALAIAYVLFGQALYHVITTFVVLLRLHVLVLIAAALANGIIGGGHIALITQVSVCFADMTRIPDDADPASNKPDRRGKMEQRRLILLGLFDAAMVFAGALGFSVMGSVIEHCGFLVSVLVFLGVYGIPVVLIWIVPDTKHKGTASHTSVSRSPSIHAVQLNSDEIEPGTLNMPNCPSVMQPTGQNTTSEVASIWNLFKSHHPATLLVFMVLFIFSAVILTESQFTFLYLMSKPFSWTPEGVGLYSGVGNFILAAASLGLSLITAWLMRVKPASSIHSSSMNRRANSTMSLLNADDVAATVVIDSDPMDQESLRLISHRQVLHSRLRMLAYVALGFLLLTVSKIIMGAAFKLPSPQCNTAAIVALAVSLLRAAVVPILKSYLSTLHSADTQGRLFSLVGVADYAGLLIGQPSLSTFYGATVSTFPGAVFFLSAALSFLAVLLISILLYSTSKELVALRSIKHSVSVAAYM